MSRPPQSPIAVCINPDCSRPVALSFTARECSCCGTTLRLNDRYIPLQRLSSGRFTSTYTVYDLKTKTEAVLKVVIEATPKTLELFQQEAKVLAKLRHPNLPRVEMGSYFQVPIKFPKPRLLPCLVMEKIPGQSLQEILSQYPQGCPESLVIDWLQQMLDGLQWLHSHQMVHRNLKPENVMVRQGSGALVLIGFGGAKRPNPSRTISLQSGARSHSQGYQSPEQIHGGILGPKTDFYALGCMGIQLLTGLHPATFENTPTGKLPWRKQVRVSTALANLLDQMVHPDANVRPKTVAEIKSSLAQITPQQRMWAIPNWMGKSGKSYPARTKRSQFQGFVQALGHSLQEFNDQYQSIMLIARMILQSMLVVSLGGIIGAALGIWLIYSSPIRSQLQVLISQTLPQLLPWHVGLHPAILIFVLAGLGSVWGALQVGETERVRHLGLASLVGSLGYGVGWLSWQWVARESPAQAFARLTAIAALFLAFQLSAKPFRLLHVFVATMGTAVTFSMLVRSKLWNPDALYTLLPATADLQIHPNIGMILSFFGLLGGIACFWTGLSQYVAVPFLTRIGRRDQ
jgi:serine/threonine protein kinase